MNTSPRSSAAPNASTLLLLAAVALLLAGLVLARLSAYGIWDPWELSVADAARKLSEGAAPSETVSLPVRLVSACFAAFGAREWAGRLPMAISGLLLLVCTGLWTGLFAGRRGGVYATLVLASTPFFLLHSREMVGATPAFLGSALVMLGGTIFMTGPASNSTRPSPAAPWQSPQPRVSKMCLPRASVAASRTVRPCGSR